MSNNTCKDGIFTIEVNLTWIERPKSRPTRSPYRRPGESA
jgi:hypothetical protein